MLPFKFQLTQPVVDQTMGLETLQGELLAFDARDASQMLSPLIHDPVRPFALHVWNKHEHFLFRDGAKSVQVHSNVAHLPCQGLVFFN